MWVVIAIASGITIAVDPLSYFTEAGSAAYYQARLAYVRGNAAQRDAVRKAFVDRKISDHEYSKLVFPAFLGVVGARGEDPFPAAELGNDQRQKLIDVMQSD